MIGPARWWKPALAGLVLLTAAAAAFWGRPRPRFAPRPTAVSRVLSPEPVAVAPGVYLLGRTDPAAAYAVETSEGLVLIDSGLETAAAPVVEQLGQLHLDVRGLRAVLLTHVHGDHSLGAEHLRAQTGARVYAGAADCAPLREGEPREAFFSTFAMPGRVPHPTTVDVELAGDETLAFGETRFRVNAAPGHTPGSVCYLLERPGLRALFTGDVITHLSPGAPDSLGTYAAYLPPLYRGNARAYLATLRRLRALPVPDLVLPGHPRMDPEPPSPHLSPGQWQGLLDQGIAEMERLSARYEADGANFLDGLPKELLPGLYYLGDFGSSTVYCLNTPRGLFLVDAPGDPLLTAFLANRFKKLGWEGRKPTAVLLTSAGAEATAGLAELVRDTGCQVVAARAAIEEVRRLCPGGVQVVPAEDLGERGWFDVRTILLGGRGLAPVAYEVRWAGKTVLFSGRIPVRLGETTAPQLLSDLAGPGGRADQYVSALDRLGQLRPALWLPAVPVHGQNANLYDDDWQKVLDANRQAVAFRPPD
jgi:glyoxylase-like metal-dependent hydrolase (beta-lactamase superfamily II)